MALVRRMVRPGAAVTVNPNLCRVVLRPSGTEPKLKVYALARAAPRVMRSELSATKIDVDELVERVLADAEAGARAIMAPYLEA